jgi:phosphatidylserine/phosphatidylglycerophosphate/cardiolipin synthase-like enzyme
VVVAVACGLLPAGAAAAATAPDPVIAAVFNNPIGTTDQQNAIITQIERLIDATPAGEEIDISMFEFNLTEVADHLNTAFDRGVRVKVIVNAGGTAAVSTLAAHLGVDDNAASWVVVCNDQFPQTTRGCVATRSYTYSSGSTTYAYNHNKFLLFSKIVRADGTSVPDVVLQTSSNLSTWYENITFNDSITFSDATVFTGYKTYFGDLTSYRHSQTGNNDYYSSTPTGTAYRAFFFPRHEASGESFSTGNVTDTIANVLKDVSCSYIGADGARHQAGIRIVMWSFTRIAVANELSALRRAGCWVDIVYNPDQMHSDVKAALTFSGGPQLTPCKFNVAPGRDIRSHTKTMLISGGFTGDSDPRVYTGSHNYAISSLRQADETLLRINNGTVYAAYLHNFYTIRDTCQAHLVALAAASSTP